MRTEKYANRLDTGLTIWAWSWPYPWHWPSIFKVDVLYSLLTAMEVLIDEINLNRPFMTVTKTFGVGKLTDMR